MDEVAKTKNPNNNIVECHIVHDRPKSEVSGRNLVVQVRSF